MLTGHIKVVIMRTKCLVGSIERKLHVFIHVYYCLKAMASNSRSPWALDTGMAGLNRFYEASTIPVPSELGY